MIEIILRLLLFRNLLKPVVNPATRISHNDKPRNIILLYINKDAVPFVCAVFAKTEPYIPSQKRIDMGLVMDIINPVKKHLMIDSFPLLSAKVKEPALTILSIPE